MDSDAMANRLESDRRRGGEVREAELPGELSSKKARGHRAAPRLQAKPSSNRQSHAGVRAAFAEPFSRRTRDSVSGGRCFGPLHKATKAARAHVHRQVSRIGKALLTRSEAVAQSIASQAEGLSLQMPAACRGPQKLQSLPTSLRPDPRNPPQHTQTIQPTTREPLL